MPKNPKKQNHYGQFTTRMTANILSEKQEVELPLPQWKENYVFSFIKPDKLKTVTNSRTQQGIWITRRKIPKFWQ